MKCPKCGYNSFEFLDTCKKCNHDLAGFKLNHGIRAIVAPLSEAGGAVAAGAAVAVAAAAMAHPPLDATSADESLTGELPPSPPATPKPGDDIFPDLDLGFAESPKPAPAEEPFSFDLEPTAPAAPPAAAPAEPSFADFSFDEPTGEVSAATPAAFEAENGVDDGFASLLETDSPDPTLAAAVADASAGVELENPWDTPTDTFSGFAIEPASASPPAEKPAASLELESFGWEEDEKKPEPAPAAGPKVELDTFSGDEFESLFGEPDEQK
ncbi:hypothetical protein [Geobacter pickeringii]|uniref:Uncharacterized protein n=1 Tax=Geobacter pickeringii TaxID=345632 RepID=A0A0B5BJB1_9BACT|nr:hypothetical protein [Geobacter pickeringii]AJE04585.1 hypothetical protein GPICK_15505 [Geobacter pickeringii]